MCRVLNVSLFSGLSVKKEPQSPGSGSSGQGYSTPARSTDEYDPELPTDDSTSGKCHNGTTVTFSQTFYDTIQTLSLIHI